MEIEIGSTVTGITDYAFKNSGLTSVSIPDSVTSIGFAAFYGCNNLKNVIFGTGVTTIGDYAFNGCGFESITIPNGITTIGEEAFEYCPVIRTIVIPATVTSIGSSAFMGANSETLTSVTFIGKTLQSVQEMSYYPWGIEDTSVINVA